MSAEEILKIIDILPNLIIYFLPGFLFMRIIRYQLSNNYKDLKGEYIVYIIISYIIISVSEFISEKVLAYSDRYSVEFTIGIVIFSIIFLIIDYL